MQIILNFCYFIFCLDAISLVGCFNGLKKVWLYEMNLLWIFAFVIASFLVCPKGGKSFIPGTEFEICSCTRITETVFMYNTEAALVESLWFLNLIAGVFSVSVVITGLFCTVS